MLNGYSSRVALQAKPADGRALGRTAILLVFLICQLQKSSEGVLIFVCAETQGEYFCMRTNHLQHSCYTSCLIRFQKISLETVKVHGKLMQVTFTLSSLGFIGKSEQALHTAFLEPAAATRLQVKL